MHAPEFVATEGMLHQACTSLVDEFDAGTHEGKHKLVLALADACDTLSQPEVQVRFLPDYSIKYAYAAHVYAYRYQCRTSDMYPLSDPPA